MRTDFLNTKDRLSLTTILPELLLAILFCLIIPAITLAGETNSITIGISSNRGWAQVGKQIIAVAENASLDVNTLRAKILEGDVAVVSDSDIIIDADIDLVGGSYDTTLIFDAQRRIIMNRGKSIVRIGDHKLNVVFCLENNKNRDAGLLLNSSTIGTNGGTITIGGEQDLMSDDNTLHSSSFQMSGGNIVAGYDSTSENAGIMTVVQDSDTMITDWQNFSIGERSTVSFIQPSSDSISLNRVVGSDVSVIQGTINANGRLILINPNGVLFTPTAMVNVGGIVVSTMDMSAEDLMAGNYPFAGDAENSINNKGSITANNKGSITAHGDGSGEGIIALIASRINNSGRLISDAGNVLLDAGTALLQQGEIIAPDGSIVITARDAYFDFGKTSVATSENERGEINAGGEIKINTTYSLSAVKGHTFDASGISGGKILMDAGESGNLLLSATTLANGYDGDGGLVQMTGKQLTLLNADIFAMGNRDGGKINLGGEWQGSGLLRHAEYLTVGSGTQLSAIGDKGRGGEVVVWSAEKTDFLGKVDAFGNNGGDNGGDNGGSIEISSIGILAFNGKLNAGDGGEVLFDPKNILVSDLYMAWVSAIVSPEPADNQDFGTEVVTSGDLLAIGAAGYDSDKGAVYLFTGMDTLASNSFQPTYVKRLSSDVSLANTTSVPTISSSERFGSGIGLDSVNGVIAIGATGFTNSQGKVYLFNNAGADYSGLEYVDFVASEVGATGMTTLIDNDYFGDSIDFDGSGNMAVGVSGRDAGGNGNAGAVFMFSNVGTDFSGLTFRWELNNQSKPATFNLSNTSNYLGISIAFSGSNLIVGSTGYNYYGGVYFFSDVATAITNNSATDLTWHATQGDPGTGTQSRFGYSLAVAGDLLFVGSTEGGYLSNPSAGAGSTGKFRQINIFSGVNAMFSGASEQSNPFSSQIIMTLSELKGGALDMPELTSTGFANSLAVNDNFLLIGTPDNPSGGTNRGEVQLLNYDADRATDAVSDAAFTNSPSDNSWISTSAIESILDLNTSITLQANNDIIISSDITKTTSGTATITLEAGRSVISNYAGITSNANDIVITAGSANANATYTDAGDQDIHLTLQNNSKLSITSSSSSPGDLILTAPDNVVIDGSATTGVYAAGAGIVKIDAGNLIHINTGGNYKNLELAGSNATALISSYALYVYNIAADLENLYFSSGTNFVIKNIGTTNGITASGTVYLSSYGSSAYTITQTEPIVADNLAIKDAGGNNDIFTLENSQNNINNIAVEEISDLTFVEADGFSTGTVSYLKNGGSTSNIIGVAAVGILDLSTDSGDISLNADVTTTDTSSDAIKLNAGKSESAGTSTGGNILANGGAVTPGAGGTAILYTGDISGSTGVTGLAGYVSSYYNSDETSGLTPGAGLYGVYREAMPAVTHSVSTYSELSTAVTTASSGDIINITADITAASIINCTKDLVFDGNDYTISVPTPGLSDAGDINDSPSTFGVFSVSDAGLNVEIKNMTIKGGYASGGCINVGSGATLRVENCLLKNGRGKNYGGGGIYNSGTVYIVDSGIIRNSANYGGGFVNNGGATMFLENSFVAQNRSEVSAGGGGAGENKGTLYVNNSTFSNNKSTEIGGAINNYYGTLWVLNSTFTGNVGYGNTTAGGAIGINGGTATVINSLFAHNYIRSGGTVTNPTAFSLDDLSKYSSTGTINSYYNVFQGGTTGHDVAQSNITYTGSADGSDNSIFSGGISSYITDANNIEIGTARVFQPFLIQVDSVTTASNRAVTLKTGSILLGSGYEGTQTGYDSSNSSSVVIGYYDKDAGTPAWVDLGAAGAGSHVVTTDQLGNDRTGFKVIGAVSEVVDDIYMLKVNADANGSVSGGSPFGELYASGTVISLTATPDTGYEFSRWEDESATLLSTDNPYIVTVNSTMNVVPVFSIFSIGEPTVPSSNIAFNNITSTSMDLSWTSGNGSSRIVLIKEGNPVDSDPLDGTTYTADSVLGSGTEIGTGNYVVYDGIGNSVTVTGLTSGTTYHFEIYEYNGSGGDENYLTTSSVNAQENTLELDHALLFNGTNNYVDFGVNPPYSETITIEAWIKTTSTAGENNIVCWGNSTGVPGAANVQFRTNDGKLELGIDEGFWPNGWLSTASTNSVNSGNWTHVAVVKSGTDVKLYIDGQEDGSGTNERSPSVNRMLIGKYYNDENYFDGTIDEVRIWNVARTQTQISDNMNSELTDSETNLVAYYKMNEGSGNSLSDSSANSYTGTLQNSPTWVTGSDKLGFRLTFDGSGDYVDCGNDSSLQSSNLNTVETWVKLSSLGQTHTLVSKYYHGSANGGYELRIDSTNVPWFIIGKNYNSWNYAASSEALEADRWYHIAGTYDGSTIKIYVDGVFKGSQSQTGIVDSGESLTIGSRSTSDFFSGQMDEVRVWNVVRSQTEIQNYMDSSLWGDEAGLVAYYRMNTGSGTTLINNSLNTPGVNNGILHGDTSWVQTDFPTPPLPVQYVVTGTARYWSGGGSVTPSTINIDENESTTLTVTPATGSSISTITGCGGTTITGPLTTATTYTTGSITADCEVLATFTHDSYTLNGTAPGAGSGGTISPGTRTVSYGDTTTFTIIPDWGYTPSVSSDCGGSYDAGSSLYTTGTITDDCEVNVTFSPVEYTVTGLVTANGTIDGNPSQSDKTVAHGATTSFIIIPDSGYTINRILGCNGNLDVNEYTTDNITGPCKVIVFFKSQ